MLVSGKIEVFKNKKGYDTGVLKSFDKDNKLVGRLFVACIIIDEKITKKMTEGKTLTLDIKKGYLGVRHVELETESFEVPVISIIEADIVAVYPEEKKATKKSTKKTTKSSK